MKFKMPFIFSFLLSVVGWGIAILSTLFFTGCGLVIGMPWILLTRDTSRKIMHWFARCWGWSIIVLNPFWKLKVTGQEHIQKGKHYVIVANHQSMLDIAVALASLPLQFKFLSKKEVFDVPVIGWHIALAKYIPIDRKSKESGRKALLLARQNLQEKISVLFFPEGTRSLDGKIYDFKVGAFKLAREVGVEILPVVIEGTGDVIPKKSWMLKKHSQLIVSIGKPISIEGTHADSFLHACETIRHEMIARLAEIRGQKHEGANP